MCVCSVYVVGGFYALWGPANDHCFINIFDVFYCLLLFVCVFGWLGGKGLTIDGLS